MQKASDSQSNLLIRARDIYISALLGLCAAGLVALPVLALSTPETQAPTNTRARKVITLAKAPKATKAAKGAKTSDLVRDSKAGDKAKRRGAIRKLGGRRSKSAVDRLKALARSKNSIDRELAHEGLARSGDAAGEKTVAAACKGGKKAACRSLQWAQDGKDDLTANLTSEDAALRSAAAFALARRGETAGLREIAEELLSSGDATVRAEAVHTLGILGRKDEGVLPVLEAALKTEADGLVLQVLQLTVRKLK
jgi:HEAT repeat protein